MTQYPVKSRFCLIFLVLTLNACTGVSVKDSGSANKETYKDRATLLNATGEWDLVGKISLDDGEDGGSGRLQWSVEHGHSELDFHGAMGRGAWRLKIGQDGVLLEMADGTVQAADDVNDLIQDHIGWPIPLDALQWWVRGLMAPGDIEKESYGPEGLLTDLRQFGWDVDFKRYASFDGVELPIRLNATNSNYRVKLAISSWRMDVNHDIKD